ncbi:MAG: YkvA family protein [Rhodospirillales bacterium]
MDTIDYSRALVPIPDQERVVESRFWKKVKKTLGRVPFLDQAIAAYYAAIDPATPRAAKSVLMAALAYFILPTDFIPDFIAGAGFTDDATVLMLAIQALAPHIKDKHVEAARTFLARDKPADQA